MRLIKNLEDYSKNSETLVAALGFFDGLHLGHQKILKSVTESSARLKAKPAVLTFQDHPQKVLKPGTPGPLLITTQEQRLRLLEKAGIEICFFIPFTETFSKLSAEDFVKQIFIERFNIKKICLGYNAHFGRQREGNPKTMRELAARYGFEFEEISHVDIAGEAVSSSRIRKMIQDGELDQASECLGRPFSIAGKVIPGDGRGKELGFPTANVDTRNELLPPQGVYPTVVRDQAKIHEGILNYGTRPTFKGEDREPVLEIHLFNFSDDLYGRDLEVYFYPRLRAEKTFSGPDALKAQIAQDIAAAKQVLGSKKPGLTRV